MNSDIIYIIKAFLPTKDLYFLELTSVLYYSTKVPLYQKELRSFAWPITNINFRHIFYLTSRHNHLNATKYLIQKFDLTKQDLQPVMNIPAYYYAAKYGHFDMLKYLVETFQLTCEDAWKKHDNYGGYCTLCGTKNQKHQNIIYYLLTTLHLTCKNF